MESVPDRQQFKKTSMQDLLQQSLKEINRLSRNKVAFYDVIPDMIFIITDDFSIQDMNRSAFEHFGDLRGKNCLRAIFGNDAFQPELPQDLINNHDDPDKANGFFELQVGDCWFQGHVIPYAGYNGDNLFIMMLKDITTLKKYESQLYKYKQNVDTIITDKIDHLNESEKKKGKLKSEINSLTKRFGNFRDSDTIVGNSKAIRKVKDMIGRVAESDATILITGESGTGKELVSDMVHRQSLRSKGPYLKFNCAAVPETLLESDLFGYERGAFTGAAQKRKGKFEIAGGGTIFLDEIGDISPKMQAALLRVLQNGEIIRVGGTSAVSVDVRVVAATNADIVEAVNTGAFRNDLFYRLNVINLHMPPLRERKEDIPLLAAFLFEKYKKAFGKNIRFLPDSIVECFMAYGWPGNIRELENVIQRAVLLTRTDTITRDNIDPRIRNSAADSGRDPGIAIDVNESFLDRTLSENISMYEKKVIETALAKWKGDTQMIADRLNISKTSLYDKMKRYGFSPKKFK